MHHVVECLLELSVASVRVQSNIPCISDCSIVRYLGVPANCCDLNKCRFEVCAWSQAMWHTICLAQIEDL